MIFEQMKNLENEVPHCTILGTNYWRKEISQEKVWGLWLVVNWFRRSEV